MVTRINRRAGHKEATTPNKLIDMYPICKESETSVVESRQIIENILSGKDNRLLVITGHCSIHDRESAIEYARRVKELQKHVKDTIYLVMRVYLEKPRTNVGWQGMLIDPDMDGSEDLGKGLIFCRQLLLDITEMGVPVATEFLDPAFATYLAGLVSWCAIGARTTESQTHRKMASGLSMPVGFKNTCKGGVKEAVDAMICANDKHHYYGWDQNGRCAFINTRGNDTCHLVLRGGESSNYSPVDLQRAQSMLSKAGFDIGLIVDCSHDNSGKQFRVQAHVFREVVQQRTSGNTLIIGLMLESHLEEGGQKFVHKETDPSSLNPKLSVTDECVGWDTTAKLINEAHVNLMNAGVKWQKAM